MTIKDILKLWNAAPTMRDKDVLVAEALGWNIIRDHPYQDLDWIGYSPKYADQKQWSVVPTYTTDHNDAAQALEEAGFFNDRVNYFYICCVWGKQWDVLLAYLDEKGRHSSLMDGLSDCKFLTEPEAMAFAAYAFRTMKEGK